MAFYSKKEFGKLAGLPNPAGIRVYIHRGKIIMSGDYIDDSIPQNKEWLEEQRKKRGIAGVVDVVEPHVVAEPEKLKEPNISQPKKQAPPESPKIKPPKKEIIVEDLENKDPKKMTKSEIELVTKRAEMEKKLKEVEKLDISIAKAKGELIPTDLVYSLITEMSEAMKIAYSDAIENYTVVVARQKKLTGEEESKIKSHFTRIINETLKRQSAVAKKGLQNIVKEYQEIRGRGESK